MDRKPLVSIVSSIYNVEKYLDKMINSLINQTYKNIEIILVDNASTDGSLKLIEKYSEIDSRIKVIRLSQNKGPAGGINEALKEVTGEYYTEIDADDWMEIECIEKVILKIDEDTDFAMWKFRECYEDGTINVFNNSFIEGKLQLSNNRDFLLSHLLDYTGQYGGVFLSEVGTPWAKLYKTSVVRELLHENNLAMFEDYLYNIRAIKKCENFYLINEIYYNLRRGTSSYSATMNIAKVRELFEVLKLIEDELKENNSLDVEYAFNIFSARLCSISFNTFSKYKLKEIYKLFTKKEISQIKIRYIKSSKFTEKSFRGFIKRNLLRLPFLICYIYFKYFN